ncbi:arm repeats containing protein [Cyclospora cayetanensis]|uniref:Arm repeats containing protein n=1 Tax=Cyclospora cayetanensis TaxID=88456 RepID=A0A1D3CZW4_9EIME|nr:arm repeats containing protein [Cyclospora cayetanensis]
MAEAAEAVTATARLPVGTHSLPVIRYHGGHFTLLFGLRGSVGQSPLLFRLVEEASVCAEESNRVRGSWLLRNIDPLLPSLNGGIASLHGFSSSSRRHQTPYTSQRAAYTSYTTKSHCSFQATRELGGPYLIWSEQSSPFTLTFTTTSTQLGCYKGIAKLLEPSCLVIYLFVVSLAYMAVDCVVGDDVVRFDRAYDNNDIPEFVRLCNSTCEIEKLEERMHPWAADPETIGALAATQLAIFASREQEPQLKDEIREAGGIEVLVKLLASKELDRKHSAVVALSFLSVDNPQNCIAMFNAGAMPYLIQGMKSDIEGMRAACAQTARNIYVLDIKYRRTFMKGGGIAQLVRFLEIPPNATNVYTQLEAIYHLEDLVGNENEELPEFVQAVKAAGAIPKLKKLQESQCRDQDVVDAANLLLARLAD